MSDEVDRFQNVLNVWEMDVGGARVLAGLTSEETEFYLELRRVVMEGWRRGTMGTREERARWLELDAKHEAARSCRHSI